MTKNMTMEFSVSGADIKAAGYADTIEVEVMLPEAAESCHFSLEVEEARNLLFALNRCIYDATTNTPVPAATDVPAAPSRYSRNRNGRR